MKQNLFLILILSLMTSMSFAANDGVASDSAFLPTPLVFGAPGNSAAARDILGVGSDPNCLGDIASAEAKLQLLGGGHEGDPGHQTVSISRNMTIGIIAGLAFGGCENIPITPQ